MEAQYDNRFDRTLAKMRAAAQTSRKDSGTRC